MFLQKVAVRVSCAVLTNVGINPVVCEKEIMEEASYANTSIFVSVFNQGYEVFFTTYVCLIFMASQTGSAGR